MENTVTSLPGGVLFGHMTPAATHQIAPIDPNRGRVTHSPRSATFRARTAPAVTEVGRGLVVY